MGCSGSKDGGSGGGGKGLTKLKAKELSAIELTEDSDEIFTTYNDLYKLVCEPNNKLVDSYDELLKAVKAIVKDAEKQKQLAANPAMAIKFAFDEMKAAGVNVSPNVDMETGEISAKFSGDMSPEMKEVEAKMDNVMKVGSEIGKSVPDIQTKATELAEKAQGVDVGALADAAKEKASNPMEAGKKVKTLKDNLASVTTLPKDLKVMTDNMQVVLGGLKGDSQE